VKIRLFAMCCLMAVLPMRAETGHDAWLRYAPLEGTQLKQVRDSVPAVIVSLGSGQVLASARDEMIRGVRGVLARTLRVEAALPDEPAIVLGTSGDLADLPALRLPGAKLDPGGYQLITYGRHVVIRGADERGVLHGAFELLRKIALGEVIGNLNEKHTPYFSLRWVNQWDNLDGTIERGYGGRSIFWENGRSRQDLSRAEDYGRLLASLGIDACAINNVNANPRVLTPELIPDIKRIADALRPWGVRVALSVDFGSPKSAGGLDTFDPLEERVAKWWAGAVDRVYDAVPDLAGFVLKADSEGRVGPSVYGRTHADAANVVARALKPHGGALFYRGFVYDHHMDWNNPKNDRARAAYDNFKPLDGQFDANVVVQIKNGPIDFQVREPASPLFGALEKTNEAIELQITQEYMGQSRHVVFLVPQWKEALDFDMKAGAAPTPVKALAAGKIFQRPLGGMAGVANVGLDDNWYESDLSQANLYGFGRLAWDPNLTSQQIASEWTRLTFGSDPVLVKTVTTMLLESWRAYEDYTGPFGLQTLTDIVGNHYGVAVEASERNGWGQWHRADAQGVGMDRTVATGTGYTGQYRPAVAHMYESVESCPDELLLFMHHVPYNHVLHSGKTVIQAIYDSHYEGAAMAQRFADQWQMLKGKVDDNRFGEILAQLNYQAGRAIVWRDAVSNWFLRTSGIPDRQHRVGNYPGRVEAESMKLEGYGIVDVTPWEAASGGKAISCSAAKCSASFLYQGDAGWHSLYVMYFDQNNGVAHFRVSVVGQSVDEWAAADHVPSRKIDGSTSKRRAIHGLALRPGDEIRIEGTPDGGDLAALDYVEIH
jgi:alpha-glucuronidase